MSEPLRERWLAAVASELGPALAAPQGWGNYPTLTVERRYKVLPTLGNTLRVMVLDDDGSHTPEPENRDGDIDDVCAFVVLIQVRGDDVTPPSTWGHRALDTVKRALRTGVDTGTLGVFTSAQPVVFGPEFVLIAPDGAEGRFQEVFLPCTAKLADNIGGAA